MSSVFPADLAVSVRGLSKSYTIAHQNARPTTAAEALSGAVRRALRPSTGKPETETFWALRDVSFDIHTGDVVGIIGRNGAGKSTLLKILSRITEPAAGQIDLYGRVGSLLEVGTGFHPELTGRENIFLNGAILGMSRREIARQFDAIVDFSGTEQFLDTPVKRYSSGMYVRLAFAVAAHLEPEILIVDEALSVGDAEFQKKCLGKMQDVAHSGRTVLFVSHNIAAISNFCTSTIVLERGRVTFQGDTATGIEQYMAAARQGVGDGDRTVASCRASSATPLITAARLRGADGRERTTFPAGVDITVEIDWEAGAAARLRAPALGVIVKHGTFGTVGGVNNRMSGFWPTGGPFTEGTLRCTLSRPPLLPGAYSVDLWLGDGPTDLDTVEDFLRFHVEEADVYGSGHPPFAHMGVVFLDATWDAAPSHAPALLAR